MDYGDTTPAPSSRDTTISSVTQAMKIGGRPTTRNSIAVACVNAPAKPVCDLSHGRLSQPRFLIALAGELGVKPTNSPVTFETRDDYFDYYRNYHAFWKLYGIDLPDS
jgi:hypothetical protein